MASNVSSADIINGNAPICFPDSGFDIFVHLAPSIKSYLKYKKEVDTDKRAGYFLIALNTGGAQIFGAEKGTGSDEEMAATVLASPTTV